MLVIRLQRIGKKHQPGYRVVVAERRSKLGAPPVEDLGFYNPFKKDLGVKKERIEHWLKMGAHLTPTVQNLCVEKKVLSLPKIALKFKAKKKEEAAAPAAPAAAAPAEEAAAPAQA